MRDLKQQCLAFFSQNIFKTFDEAYRMHNKQSP